MGTTTLSHSSIRELILFIERRQTTLTGTAKRVVKLVLTDPKLMAKLEVTQSKSKPDEELSDICEKLVTLVYQHPQAQKLGIRSMNRAADFIIDWTREYRNSRRTVTK